MSELAIQVEGLSKRYEIGAAEQPYRTLRDSISDALATPFKRLQSVLRGDLPGVDREILWALKDVSFQIRRGEVVGVIGRNGAGKTTLLKVLSRITEPTEGRAVIHGRVGSLLEVGTGFHPELTGRENVYLNAAILGMKKSQIDKKFDDIVSFAEVERFLDTPVKRYSSGMYVRLAFAVAAHLEPEILMVDEVLAVGDAAFQKRCLGKMGDIALTGRTVLFVSHNMAAVRALCPETVWLENGRVRAIGPSNELVPEYLRSTDTSQQSHQFTGIKVRSDIELHSMRLESLDGDALDEIWVSSSFRIRVGFVAREPALRLHLSLEIWNHEEICVFASTSASGEKWHGRPFETGFYESTCVIPAWLLNAGFYSARLHFVRESSVVVCSFHDVLRFEIGDVIEDRGAWFGKWPGVVRPRLKWTTRLVERRATERT